MPRKKKINNKQLIEMVKAGDSRKAIMDKFGFKNSNQLKVAYANAMMETGEIPVIKAGRASKKTAGAQKRVFVNKRGSLVIPKGMVEQFGLQQGDTFAVRVSKAGLSLKKSEA